MPTDWILPTSTAQFAEADPPHISWKMVGVDFEETNFVTTTKPLLHIANPLVNDLKMKTYYLVFNGFNWTNLPEVISGIEVYINLRRGGRITDETIQLWNQSLIGDNKANTDLANLKTYGGETDTWGLASTNPNQLDENFGICLRYQSHPNWPHSTAPYMEHVQIRIW